MSETPTPPSPGGRFRSTATAVEGASGSLTYQGRVAGGSVTFNVRGELCGWGPELIITNGAVYTVTGGTAEAVAVQDGRIIAVGTNSDAEETDLGFAETEVMDAGGMAVLPAFIDSHSHGWEGHVGEPRVVEDELFAQGITTFGEPTAHPGDIAALRLLDSTGQLRIRTRMWLAYNDFCGNVLPGAPHLAEAISRDPGATFAVLGTKIFADGGACRTPAISFTYTIKPGDPDLPPNGELYLTAGQLADVVQRADALGHQVIIHAIGDRGVETAVTGLGDVIAGSGNPNRHRIEHNTLVRPDVIPDFVRHDIGAVVFGEYPTCLHNTGGWWAQHLDATNIDWLHPWRDLVDAGITVGWQADVPYFTRDTMHQWFSLASLGQAAAPITEGGPGPCAADATLASHALTVEEALEVMTLGSATLMHLDSEVGSIEVGKSADLVLLDGDPIAGGDASDLLDHAIVWTMTRGEVVHCVDGPVTCAD